MLTVQEWRAVVYRGKIVFDTTDENGRLHDDLGRFAKQSSLDVIAKVPRRAVDFGQARQSARAFQGRVLTNTSSGIQASVSRNSLDKMLSQSAVSKSTSAADHALAVANIDHLYPHARYGWSKVDRDKDSNIRAVHRLFAPMDTSSGTRIVKLTVKESARKDQGSKIYTVEALEIENPASIWVDSTVRGDGLDPTSTPYAGSIRSLVHDVQARNKVG